MVNSKQAPTYAEIGKELKITKGRVSQLASVGMPVDSIEAAVKWRALHSSDHGNQKVASKSAVEAAKEILRTTTTPAIAGDVTGDDAESVLNRLREDERQGYSLLQKVTARAAETMKDEDVGAIAPVRRSYMTAVNNRLDVEKRWDKHRIQTGMLVSLEFAQDLVSRILTPLHTQLEQFPKLTAGNANPENPAAAEKAMEAGLDSINRQIRQTLSEPAKL